MAHSIEEVFRGIAHSRKRGIPDAATIATGISGGGPELSSSLSQAGSEIAQLRATFQQQADLIKANTQALQNNASGQSGHSAAGAAGSAISGIFGGAAGFLSPIVSGITKLFSGLFGGAAAPVALPIYVPPPPISIGGTLHSESSQDAASAKVGPDALTPQAGSRAESQASGAIAQLQAGLSADSSSEPAPARLFGGLFAASTQAAAPPIYSPQIPPAPIARAAEQASNAEDATGGSSNGNPRPAVSGSTTYAPQITVHVSAMDSESFMDRSSDIASAVREAMLNNHPINGVVADL